MKERDYDVIVYGAGPEGVAAALAVAERSGSVLLADDCADAGGSSVCGLMNWWRGESDSPLTEHLRKLTRRAWGRLIFEPEELGQAFRRLLKAAGVDVLLGARAVKAKTRRGIVKSVTLAGHCGREKLSAWCYVDASQDFLLSRLADCCMDGEDGEPSVALLARVGGIDTRMPGVFDQDMPAQYAVQFESELAVEYLPEGIAFPSLVPCLRGGTAIMDASGDGVPVRDGPLGRTEAEARCREHALAAIGFLQRNVSGYENCHLIHFAGQPLSLCRAQPVRRRAESASMEEYAPAIEDIVTMSYPDAQNAAVSVAVPMGNLMCRDMSNLLLARAEGLSSDQAPLLFTCGGIAGRIAAEAVLYDGDVSKLDMDRVLKAVRGGE